MRRKLRKDMKILIYGLVRGRQLLQRSCLTILKSHILMRIVLDRRMTIGISPLQGRERQFNRMCEYFHTVGFGIADFVCPLDIFRGNLHADYRIFMDTIESGRFEDTNKVFERPDQSWFEGENDLRITKWIGQNQLRKCWRFRFLQRTYRTFKRCLPKLVK